VFPQVNIFKLTTICVNAFPLNIA